MSASSKKKLRKEQEALQMTEKQQQAKKEAKQLKVYTIAFVLVMAIVVVAFVGTMVYKHLDNTGFLMRNSTALKVNNHKISATELNYFYVDAISTQYNDWYNDYEDYTSTYLYYLYGLNISMPLNESYYDTEGKVTWAEMFANVAISDATEAYALYDAAKAAGHTLSEEEKQNIETTLANIDTYAIFYGYENLEAYLEGMYGKGANEKTFRHYLEVTSLASSYLYAYSDSIVYTDSDYAAHLAEHPNDYSSFTYSSYQMYVSEFYPEKAEGESYTEDEMAAARQAAQEAGAIIEKANISGVEDLEAALAGLSIYSGAEDSAPTVSTYENVDYANLSTHIQEWMADSSRKVGDFTVVPITTSSTDAEGVVTTTVNSYYFVIFEGREDNNVPMVNVRHILAEFEGGTTDTSGKVTYTEAEKAAAKAEIDAVLALFEATGKTEEDFAALVHDNTDDSGSKENGGLYEDVYPNQMVPGFNDWCFDANRKVGDYEIVETEYGYHLIYFVSYDEQTYRDYKIDTTLRNEALTAWVDGLVEAAKVSGKDISKLDLDFVISPSTSY